MASAPAAKARTELNVAITYLDRAAVLYALAELTGCAAAEIECARVRKARTHGTYTRRLLWQPAPAPEPGRDTWSRRHPEPRAHPAPHRMEATR